MLKTLTMAGLVASRCTGALARGWAIAGQMGRHS